ncbi:MAG: argonaute/piwi family protein, partial [Bacteroidia bacterium]
DEVYQHGRIKSKGLGDPIKKGIKSKYDRENKGLFDEIDQEYAKIKESYHYDNHFHNQLKLKLLQHEILTQIIRESTIAYNEYPYLNVKGEPKRDLSKMETDIAWNIATSVYYKIGGLPWKLGSIRKDVCYIGLVFKVDERQKNSKYACCAAQMFLDSGDGMVFKGAVGPWYNEDTKEFHLTKEAAFDLLHKALKSFQKSNEENLPKEIFIHGKTQYSNDEWAGFCEAVEEFDISLIGVTIKDEKIFKLYRDKNFPILRGSYYIKDKNNAFLWTKGFIPRLQQPLGLETPNPLTIKLIRGKGHVSIDTVCRDILALTKLNYNSCRFCDGMPVTLKFANVIGDILTTGKIENLKPALPFRYYI